MAGRPKGIPKTGGRQPGSENKVTRETKEVIADLLKLTAPIYAELLIEAARSTDPDKKDQFMTRFERLIEYDVPKLQRSEIHAEVKTEIRDTILKAFDQVDEADQANNADEALQQEP